MQLRFELRNDCEDGFVRFVRNQSGQGTLVTGAEIYVQSGVGALATEDLNCDGLAAVVYVKPDLRGPEVLGIAVTDAVARHFATCSTSCITPCSYQAAIVVVSLK